MSVKIPTPSDRDQEKHDYRVTTWRPSGGLHPRMREFQCHGCGKTYFVICSQKRLDSLARRFVNNAAWPDA
jgi:hypothetical protein